MDFGTFRDILREEFEIRVRGNSSYSLRSFAKKLNIAPSRLSEVLNNKQGISEKWAIKIAETLNFDENKSRHFILLVQSETSKSKIKKEAAKKELKEFNTTIIKKLPLDQYNFVSNWYNAAILEISKLGNFKSSSMWIAEKLDISDSQAKDAIALLKKFGFLTQRQGKLVHNPKGVLSTESPTPSEYIRKFHQNVIMKAQSAIFDQNIDQRQLNTLIYALSDEELEDLKLEVKNFYTKISKKYSSKSKKKSKLYAISTQLFDLIHQ